ncbi:MAG TPA: hypothetical protein VFN94_04570, partial [Nitrospiria bacterium]|nr:hypothetical protein [Nitrospiria bacterium]
MEWTDGRTGQGRRPTNVLITTTPKQILFTKRLQIFIAATGTLCSALGLTVMIGWHTHALVVVQVRPDFAAMRYNTALSFLFLGLGLFAAARGRVRWTLVCGIWPTAIGVGTVVEYLAGTNLGIDQLVFTHYMAAGVSHVGRMGLNTAVCYALSGCALLTLGRPIAFRLRPLFVGTCGLVTLGVA